MVLLRMQELGITKASLSRSLKVSKSAITTLFDEVTRVSRLVPAIHKLLRLPVPHSTRVDESGADSSIMVNWALLDPDQKIMVSGLVGGLVAAKKRR